MKVLESTHRRSFWRGHYLYHFIGEGPLRAFIITLIVIIIIGMYLTIDYKLGRKNHLTNFRSNEFPARESELEIFTEGNDLFQQMFTDIQNAQNHIHVLFYICKKDSLGQEFLTLLKTKAKEGVEVRLLLDWVGSFQIGKEMIKELQAAGVEFSFSNKPKAPYFFYTSQARNHRKITIIDGATGYMGGYNVGEEYIDLDSKLSPWRDYHLKMTGEGVQDLQTQFLIDWEAATKTNLLQNVVYFPQLPKGTTRHTLITNEGILLEDTFSDLIGNAKDSITIGSPYFIPSKRVFNHLLAALDRGVTLTILVPYLSDHALVQEASYPFLRQLLHKGANVYQFKNGFYHAKVLLIDEQILDIGTANFDRRSLFLNQEINCYIHDPAIIEEMTLILKEDIQDSRKLSKEDLQSLGFFTTMKEWIAKLFIHFL